MNNVLLLVNDEQAKAISAYYGPSLPLSTPFMAYFAKGENCSITIYKSIDKQGLRKCLFQGEHADKEAAIFGIPFAKKVEAPNKKATVSRSFRYLGEQVGSDEVGTGDFFGPIVVSASYVEPAQLELLKTLHIVDSKKMEDAYIREIVPGILKTFDHSILVLKNEKFNEAREQGLNMNVLKAKAHNLALLKVSSRHEGAKIFQDQFAEPSLYYSYLKGEPQICSSIHFETKGESKYPSVALASVFARYAFLIEMDKISQELGSSVPLGAGPLVDEYAAKLKEKIGIDGLRKYVKANFVNFKKLP